MRIKVGTKAVMLRTKKGSMEGGIEFEPFPWPFEMLSAQSSTQPAQLVADRSEAESVAKR